MHCSLVFDPGEIDFQNLIFFQKKDSYSESDKYSEYDPKTNSKGGFDIRYLCNAEIPSKNQKHN